MSKITKSIVCIAIASLLFLGGCSNSTTNKKDTTIISSEDTNNKNDDSNNGQEVNSAKDSFLEETNKELTKQVYINKLDELQTNLDASLKEKYESGVTLVMVEAASEEYKKWDDMLNEIYSKLRDQLSEIEMEKLTQEELNWIHSRDEKGEAADDGYEDGSIASLLRTDSMAKTTKERCYELVNNYIK